MLTRRALSTVCCIVLIAAAQGALSSEVVRPRIPSSRAHLEV